MRIGVAIEETWDFFGEIYEELCEHHQVNLFERRAIQSLLFRERINRRLFHRDLQTLMRTSDVVYFEWASHLLAAATHMRKSSGIVTRLHRYEMYQWVDEINWDAVDKIILVSEAKRREFIDRFPAQAAKVEVIPVGVSVDKFRPQTKTFSGDIGILCHLTPRKRVYDLLLTFYELNQLSNDFHLHIAGGQHPSHGDYYFALQDAVKVLDLQNQVTFYGNISDTWDWYHKIDIFISNSYSEGLQVAPMEAMASGCFCLAHRWAGADELLPEENLYVTGQELNQKILSFSESSSVGKLEKKRQMRDIVRYKFDVNKAKVRVRQVIENVVISATKRQSSYKTQGLSTRQNAG